MAGLEGTDPVVDKIHPGVGIDLDTARPVDNHVVGTVVVVRRGAGDQVVACNLAAVDD